MPKDFEFVYVRTLTTYRSSTRTTIRSPPEPVLRVKAQMTKANASSFATPEHNRSMPAALKDVLHRVSRPYGKKLWSG